MITSQKKQLFERTYNEPIWVHFGAGNIFRGFPAALQQDLIEQGKSDKGIIVGEGFDFEIIDAVYAPYDNETILAVLNSDGTIEIKQIQSVTEAYACDPDFQDQWSRFRQVFASESLQMVSFTITEKGYSIQDNDGNMTQSILDDIAAGPEGPRSMMAKITALLYARYRTCGTPVSLVSMDNCSHNGEKLEFAVTAIAEQWVASGRMEQGFLSYLEDSVSFPWSMIDKITPRPDTSVRDYLRSKGYDQTDITVTAKHSWVAPFVNTEKPQYLVIEDGFPNGRPPLEEVGVLFTDRETVNKVERMKVCTCLNPLHTALAVFGCLLGYTLISDEMKDPLLRRMVEMIGYDEGLPVVTDPGVIHPEAFLEEVLNVRFPNPFMPDTPQRIVCDTSQKLSIRFGETIKAYMESDSLFPESLRAIPLVLAGWLRYLMGVNDAGEVFEISPDPGMNRIRPYLEGITIGGTNQFAEIKQVLGDSSLFGVDLYEAGLGDRVVAHFSEMVEKAGAVRLVLEKYIYSLD